MKGKPEAVAHDAKPSARADGGPRRPATPRARQRSPRLRVVLDTNQIHTGSASDLLSTAARALIEESNRHQDICIEWLVPQVVMWEREYQMAEVARGFLPTLTKLERLLGAPLGISADSLALQVRSALDNQVRDLGLTVVPLEPGSVDWPNVIHSAAFRRPPFEKGEKEKGFRDAMIGECFHQIVATSPKSASACRVVLVTGDAQLTKAVAGRNRDSNVRLLSGLDDLRGLINALVSNVTEEFVKSVRAEADAFFRGSQSKAGLFQSAAVRERIQRDFAAELATAPATEGTRTNDQWTAGEPRFVSKQRQRITWTSSVYVEGTGETEILTPEWPFFHFADQPSRLAGTLMDSTTFSSPPLTSSVLTPKSAPMGHLFTPFKFSGDEIAQPPPRIQVTFSDVFAVTWSAIVTAGKKFRNGRIESIKWTDRAR